MQKNWTGLLTGALVLAFCASSAWGHAVWLEPRQGEVVVVYGEGPQEDAYTPDRIKSIEAYSASGRTVSADTGADKGGYLLLAAPDTAALVAMEMDIGFYTQDADGSWHNKPRREVSNAKQAGHFVKYNLSVLDHVRKMPRRIDLPLVIVPQSDPLKLNSGDELRVRVLHRGKPLADADLIGDYVNQASRVSAKTDEDGYATLTVRNDGFNLLAVSFNEELTNDPDADRLGMMSTLSFSLHYRRSRD